MDNAAGRSRLKILVSFLYNETFAWQLVNILFVNSLYNRELFCIFEY